MKNQTREDRMRGIILHGEITAESIESTKITRSLFPGENGAIVFASALYDIGKADGKAEMRTMDRAKESMPTLAPIQPEKTFTIR